MSVFFMCLSTPRIDSVLRYDSILLANQLGAAPAIMKFQHPGVLLLNTWLFELGGNASLETYSTNAGSPPHVHLIASLSGFRDSESSYSLLKHAFH
jgi:hypothetical protein